MSLPPVLFDDGTAIQHADYPHEAGTLYDCPACESVCLCPDCALYTTKVTITAYGITVPCCQDEEHREYVRQAITRALSRGGYA